jgi:pilus assembly protein CpaB
MRAKSMALLMLALGCGLVASIGITQVMAKRNVEQNTPAGDSVPIFVAIKDISLGEPLSSAVLKKESWPKDKVPPGALTKIEDVERRRVRQKLFAGEPVLENKLLSKGASSQGASAVIPQGYRVVSVQVDAVSGSGLILPGDRVDVLVYLSGNSSKQDVRETSTRSVLQDIKVFAVNDVVELDKDGKDKTIIAKTISLLVTPAQAAKVTLASEMGKIRLVMRGPEDDAHTEDVSAKPDELFGHSAFADRAKEAVPEKKPDNNKSSLMEIWNQLKVHAANQPQTKISWTMRILNPEGINDVLMQTDKDEPSMNSAPGQWRIIKSDVDGANKDNSSANHSPGINMKKDADSSVSMPGLIAQPPAPSAAISAAPVLPPEANVEKSQEQNSFGPSESGN